MPPTGPRKSPVPAQGTTSAISNPTSASTAAVVGGNEVPYATTSSSSPVLSSHSGTNGSLATTNGSAIQEQNAGSGNASVPRPTNTFSGDGIASAAQTITMPNNNGNIDTLSGPQINNTSTGISRTVKTEPDTSNTAAPVPQNDVPPVNPLTRLEILDAKASLRDDGVEKVDSVEWGPGKHEDGYDTDQTLAPRPRTERLGEPCGCQTPDILLNFQADGASTTLEELIKEHMCCRDDSCVNYAMREECRSNCEAADFCGNKRLQNKDFCPTAVINAGPKGRGLAVLTDCKKGDFLAEYVGQAISNKALPKLFRRYQHERRLYIMALDDKTYIDARLKGGVARFINHSCSPNAKVERWKVKGVLRAVVVAIKDIPKGSEVTFDYQWQRQRGRALTKCYCNEPNCRGTLEQQALSKEQQDQNLQKKQDGEEGNGIALPEGRWLKGLSVWTAKLPEKDTFQKADETLVNRAIRVYSREHQEYFVGEVTGYDAEKGLHEVLYQEDFVEMWENLHENDWMVLEEENPQQSASSILRKAKRMNIRSSSDKHDQEAAKPLWISGSSKPLKNYIYVQTPVKEALWARHLVERCERTCSVQIRPTSISSSMPSKNSDDSEEAEKSAALQQSKDGVVWKLTITGGDIFRAHNILTKNVAYVKRMLEENVSSRRPGTDTPPNTPTEQVIYPRLIADAVKRKFNFIRDRCRNVNLTFAPSESITKQFSRLVIEGTSATDVENAKSFIWTTLLNLCTEMKVPMTTHGIPYNFGFFCGELTKDQLAKLGISQSDTSPEGTTESESTEPQYSVPFFKSFGESFKCTVWVQPDEDMGRIASYRVVADAMSTDLRKVYIGCDPADIPTRWSQIKERVKNLESGMRLIHLGADRIYQPLMLQNNFFSYVYSITGATVTIDTLTGDHLLIDGGTFTATPAILPFGLSTSHAKEKADLAADIVRFQIELYRDHHTKKNCWIFGRDWSLSVQVTYEQDTASSQRSFFGKLDEKSAQQCCIEIAGVVANMGLKEDVGGHAAVILYRFLNVESSPTMKAREAALACTYIANKAQKEHKWRKIEALVKAGYATMYPETEYDANREDVIVLEEKVIAVEREILERLGYDVFLKDTKTILSIIGAVAINGEQVSRRTSELAFSGQVLGAGSELWLKFGVEYVVVACAALLGVDVEALVPALSLIPLKVQAAAEILVENVKFGPPAVVSFLEQSRNDAKKLLHPIQSKCAKMSLKNPAGTNVSLPEVATAARRFQGVSLSNQMHYVIQGVLSSDCRQFILPKLDKLLADGQCSVFVDPGIRPETNNIVIVGSWRAVGVVEHAISTLVSALPEAVALPPTEQVSVAYNSKTHSGILSTTDIQTSMEWTDTNHSLAWAYDKGIRVGGRSCVAARIAQPVLAAAGLRWWIPKRVTTSQNGAISSSLVGKMPNESASALLSNFANSYMGSLASYPKLLSMNENNEECKGDKIPYMATSLQRWPPEKISQNEKKKASKSKKKTLYGFSSAALQEMQLLTRLHSVVISPRGHPNFVLPVAIAIPPITDTKKEIQKEEEDPMFSLFKSTEENESTLKKDKKVKESLHIVFDPCPYVLPRFLARKKESDDVLKFPAVVSAWFYDLISALAHCHDNNVIVRSLLPDQIAIDNSGVAKFGGLYRSTIINERSRKSALELAQYAKKKGESTEDEIGVTPVTAPELLMGCPRHGFETDIWIMGCVLSNILLGKPLFSGKERSSLLTSQFKIVGTPGSTNYPDGKSFPLYEKPIRKYKRGVEKAFKHMMNDESYEMYKSHVDLIASMLHLDPSERCSAEEALQHPCIAHMHIASPSASVRSEYAVQWNKLRDSLIRTQEEHSESMSYQKRKAMLISAVGDTTGEGKSDDLYDLDDLLEPTKKSKTS